MEAPTGIRKTCTVCGATKDLNLYYFGKCADGRMSHCAQCQRDMVNVYTNENRESHNTRQRQAREANPELFKYRAYEQNCLKTIQAMFMLAGVQMWRDMITNMGLINPNEIADDEFVQVPIIRTYGR